MQDITAQDSPFTFRSKTLPNLGVGIGYRKSIGNQILRNLEEIDFLELITDNFVRNPQTLRVLSSLVPCVMHSLNGSVGTTSEPAYAAKVAAIAAQAGAPFHTDHLAFTRIDGRNIGHLAPIPYTDEALRRVVYNVKQIMKDSAIPFALENISTPFYFSHSSMEEVDFLQELTRQTGCGILLDLENLRVNAVNHGISPKQYIDRLPLERIFQVHVAGGTNAQGIEHDSHNTPVPEATWNLLQYLNDLVTIPAVLLERDASFNNFDEILRDVRRARGIVEERR